jgi:cellulose synthase/poly-beta-1,6-N-acetylglucosamine synthase-like glycosyltransferase
MIAEIAGTILLLMTLPGTIELALLTLGALFPNGKEKPFSSSSMLPKIVVIVPAHNEEMGITKPLKSLKACPDPFTLVVVADNCTDRTAALVSTFGIRVIERKDPEKMGKNYALQFAFEKLLKEDFDVFMVIDADTIVGPNLIEAASDAFKHGCEAIQVKYALERPYQSYRNRLLNIAFIAFNFLRPKGRQRWGFSAGLLGNGFALSRETLLSVPFREESIVEDLAYHIHLVMAQHRVTFIENTGVYAKMPFDRHSFDVQRSRWEGGRLNLFLQEFWPMLQAIGKGNFKLIEPLLDLMLLPLGYHVLLLILLALIPMTIAKVFAFIGFSVLILHTLTAIWLSRGGWKDYLALLYAPVYVIEKVSRLGKIFNGASKGQWDRTPRDK